MCPWCTVASGEAAADNPFRFSTKYLDNETGLYYYGLRFYNPEVGRWVSRDPIGEYGGRNLYGFVDNRPTIEIDPFGEKKRTLSRDPFQIKGTGTCGSFFWTVWLKIVPGNSQWFWSWGDIVQHAGFEKTIHHCNKKGDVTWTEWDSADFAEKGRVGPSEDRRKDIWSWSGAGADTKGTATYYGSAAYYRRYDMPGNQPPPHDNVYDPWPPPDLPSTPDSNFLNREIVLEWDCCCGSTDWGTKVSGW